MAVLLPLAPMVKKLLLADYNNHRVFIFYTIPTTATQAPDLVIGQTVLTGKTGGTSATQLLYPSGICVTPDGKVLIADKGNHRVMIYNSIPTANGIAADLVLAQTNFTTGTSSTEASNLYGHQGVTVSNTGKLLVGEQHWGSRMLDWNTFPTTNGLAAKVVVGQSGFGVTPVTSATQTTVGYGSYPAISPQWVLSICDALNFRVFLFNSIPTSNGAAASTVIGQSTFTTNATGSTATGLRNNVNWGSSVFTPDGRLIFNDIGKNRINTYGVAPCQSQNLSVGITASSTSLCQSASFSYTVTVTNPSAYAVPTTYISAEVPYALTYVSASPSTGSYIQAGGTWTIPSIPSISSVTLTLDTTVPAALASSTYTAFTGITGTSFLESNYSDNAGSVVVTVYVPPSTPSISGTTRFCAGSSSVLTATAGAENYTWSSDAGTT